jgi:protease-4
MAFVRGLWSFVVGVKDALVLLLLLLLFGGLWLLSPLAVPPSFDRGALKLELKGTIVDQAAELEPADLLGGTSIAAETEVGDIVHALDRAATDPRIRMVVLDLDGFMGGGQANLEAVGDALVRFRKSGKKVTSFASVYTDDSYLLAAHGNSIWMAPEGAVLLTGPGGSNLYFKQALDRLQVNIEVFRVGTYKSFIEPFTRDGRSPEARAADQQLATDLWDNYRARIARQRPGVDLGQLMATMPERLAGANRPASELAADWHLVDRLGGRIAFGQAIAAEVGADGDSEELDSYSNIGLADYLHLRHQRSRGPAVGIVRVTGPIVDGDGSAGQAGGDTIASLVGRAVADPDVKALVVRVDSGGGSVLASERIREALAAARATGMPVVASLGPVAASGGYWLATAADAIYARPSTITGSIGVFAIIPTFERTLKKFGVTSDAVATTPFSGQPDIIGGLNAPTRAFLQSEVENTYARFIGLVARARRLPPAEVERMAEGRVWSGSRALGLKLIDGYGDLDVAVAEAARRAKLPRGTARMKEIRPDRSMLWQLFDPRPQREQEEDGLSALINRSRARAVAQVQSALSVATGASIQTACLPCVGYQPPRAIRAGLIEKIAADPLASIAAAVEAR